MNKLLQKAKWLCLKLENLPLIGKYFGNIPLLCDMIREYINGSYREVPLATIIMVFLAIFYFVSPIDIIPDAIPLIGSLDDATVVGLVLEALSNDIQSYRNSKHKNNAKM